MRLSSFQPKPADYHPVPDEAVQAIRDRFPFETDLALILGSGLGVFCRSIADRTAIPAAHIPGYPQSTVEGHQGQWILGKLSGTPIIVVQGRVHYYEGYDLHQVTLPIRLLHALGVRRLVVSNSAGLLHTDFEPGDLMIIENHLGYLQAGAMRTAIVESVMPADRSPYDREYRKIAMQSERHISGLREGIYIATTGPSYETPAEVRMLQATGADAVGMSTVPEVNTAYALGMRVLGISCLTNYAAGLKRGTLSHTKVLEKARDSSDRLKTLLEAVIPKMS